MVHAKCNPALSHCPAMSIVKIFMPIEVIHLILTARKNGFGKVVSDNLLMEGKFSYFNFNALQCKKLAYFSNFEPFFPSNSILLIFWIE